MSAVRSFDPVGPGSARAQIGRLVVRRATWTTAARELPASPEDLAAWARERGIPRRVFVRSPLERKPKFVDLESQTQCRTLARFIRPARDQAADLPVQITEMLPAPNQCWLQDPHGHYTSELRIVALDRASQVGRGLRIDPADAAALRASYARTVAAAGRGPHVQPIPAHLP